MSNLNKHVVILCTGKLTPWQRKRADELCQVRIPMLKKAIKWLIENHSGWAHVDYEGKLEELNQRKPEFIDRSEEVESVSSNVEEEEVRSL